MDVTGKRPPAAARSGDERDAQRLFAAAEPDFARYELVKDLVDECIDLSLNYRQSGHPGGSRSKVHMMLSLLLSGAMRWDVLRPVAPVRRPVRAVRRAHGAARLRHARGAERGGPGPARARRGGRVRVPRRRPLGADLGVAAAPAPPRRPARARRDGRPDAVPEVQHRPLRARHAPGRGGGAQPEAGRRQRGEGVRFRGRGRAHPGLGARDQEPGLGPGPGQPGVHGRLERLRHRPAPGLHRGRGHAGGLVRAVRLAGQRHRARHGMGPGHPGGAGGGLRREPRPRADDGLVRHAQGPRLRQVRRGQPRHGVADERRAVLGHAQGVHGQVRGDVRGRRRARPGQSRGGRGPGRGEPAGGHERAAPRRRPGDLAVGPAAGHRRLGTRRGRRLPARRRLARRVLRPPHLRRGQLPRQHVEKARREGSEPGGPGRLGRVRELARAARLRPAAVHRGLRRPGRVHEHRRVRPRLRRLARHGLVRAERQPDRGPAAHRDHRVLQRRPGRRAGHGQPGRGPVRGSSTATGARAPRTARSPTSSTGRCGCSAS